MLPTAKMLKTKLMGVRAALGWQQLLLSLALGQDSQGTPCCDVLGCPCHPGRPLLSCCVVTEGPVPGPGCPSVPINPAKMLGVWMQTLVSSSCRELL